MKKNKKQNYRIYDETLPYFPKIHGSDYNEIRDLTTEKLEYFPSLKNPITKYLVNFQGVNGRALNVILNFLGTTSLNPPDEFGSLQSQCGQTSCVIDYLFCVNRLPISERTSYERAFVNKIPNYHRKILPVLNYILKYEFRKATNSTEWNRNKDQIFTKIYSICDDLDALKIRYGGNWYSNIKINIPSNLHGFPGHVFNIIISNKENEMSNPKCRSIYVIQSFIYQYNTRVFWTNDIDDLYEFINRYLTIFINDLSSTDFTIDDSLNAKEIFGSELTDYSGYSLIGKEKPSVLLFTCAKPINFNEFEKIYNEYFIETAEKMKNDLERMGQLENVSKNFVYLTDKYLRRTNPYSKRLNEYINQMKSINTTRLDISNLLILNEYGVGEFLLSKETRSSQSSQQTEPFVY
jgi:hypothetical protein